MEKLKKEKAAEIDGIPIKAWKYEEEKVNRRFADEPCRKILLSITSAQ